MRGLMEKSIEEKRKGEGGRERGSTYPAFAAFAANFSP